VNGPLKVAATALESSLLKYSAKDYFFSASLCHMCVDSLNAQHAVQRYEDQVHTEQNEGR
jgi:alpha-soluble NSF attachment protein